MPVDYSKFDNIVDSDDEKPAEKTQAKVEKAAEKPHCANCHKDVDKPLKCGTCKKVMYCTQQCQREDWQFHKRACKKPEEPKPRSDPPKAKPAGDGESKQSDTKSRKKKDEKVVEDDEIPNWYRHREWKPDQPKQEFKPTKLEGADAQNASAAEKPATASGKSAWNKADTWEEKDVTAHAKSTLQERLTGIPDIDCAGGALGVTEVNSVEGEASRPVIRGKQRHMFDLGFRVSFVFKWMDGNGQQRAEGSLQIADFTNDTSFDCSENDPGIALTFKDSGKLDVSRRQAVEASLGAKTWPAPAGSLMAAVSERMAAWSKEFQKE